jgi:hypothetical protein
VFRERHNPPNAVFALVIDRDGYSGKAGAEFAEPTMRVETSPGSGHDWFFLDKAISGKDAQALGAALRRVIGADTATFKPTQPYRVAGTPNYPNAKKLASGRTTCGTQFINGGPVYSGDNLRELIGDMPATSEEAPEGPSPFDAEKNGVTSKRVEKILSEPGANRSDRFYAAVLAAIEDGMTIGDFEDLCREYPDGCAEKYLKPDRLREEIKRVRAKEGERIANELAEKAKKKSRIHLVPFEEIRLSTQRRDLIKGLFPRVGIAVVWGPPKCGKSFWVFDAVMHVALGWKYRGRRVHAGAVVYCAFEGQSGFEARAEAFRQKYLSDGERVPFHLMPATLNLVKDHKALIAAIAEAFGDQGPVCVVLDTLNRSLEGSESKDEDMSAYIQAADAIREKFNCSVIIVHHCGVDGTRPRGHTSLTGALDVQLKVSRDGDNRVKVEVELSKDGPQGEEILSELEVVEVGKDEDGEPITSCLVLAADEDIKPAKAREWPKGLRVVRDAITEAMINQGFDHKITNGPTVRAVATKDAREVHRRKYAHNGDGDREAAERQAWGRNFNKVKAERLIGSDLVGGRDIIWLLDNGKRELAVGNVIQWVNNELLSKGTL